tara:strand:- start:721 stop:1338 length:618 start_codon:yes stop_codon:yes gene_type:complete
MTLATRAWVDQPVPIAVFSLRKLYTRINRTEASVRRAMVTLKTPAGHEYRWGRGGCNAREGHGILTQERIGINPTPSAYRLVLDWTAWNWDRQVDLRLVANALECAPTLDASREAVEAALVVHRYVLLHDGDPPHRDSMEPRWVVWCQAMDRILRRGFTLEDVQIALVEADRDAYWQGRLAHPDAAIALETHINGFLLRAQRRAS